MILINQGDQGVGHIILVDKLQQRIETQHGDDKGSLQVACLVAVHSGSQDGAGAQNGYNAVGMFFLKLEGLMFCVDLVCQKT
ncbi:MAG: hypothetical protein ACD_62C00104G0004 [uncultured bacterium]|nr:MAG: hypothetical protein ACD_62C00104G0004 [uncultured bacterium]